MQRWKKLGIIYDKQYYNAVPVGHFISDHVMHIYFSTRNEQNHSLPFLVVYDFSVGKITHEQYIDIPLGQLGTFDENGIMPTSLIQKENALYLYYIGWNIGKTVPFRNSIGLAISQDGGITFKKYSEGPVLDRSIYDKCFVASNHIYPEQDFYRMYYLSCNKWKYQNGKLSHEYNIKYAESEDGIHWTREGKVVIDFENKEEYAISVPRVIKDGSLYKMWYSYRGSAQAKSYRIGYAESSNAVDWHRKDHLVGLDISVDGWDSEMICYPFVFDYEGQRYMLYNGNQYGQTGIGLAMLES